MKIQLDVTPPPEIAHRFMMLWKKEPIVDDVCKTQIDPKSSQVYPKWDAIQSQSFLQEWGGMKVW